MNARTTVAAVTLLAFSIVMVGVQVATASVILVDDFSDTDLSEYTQTLVLDQNPSSDISFASPAGALQVSKASGVEAEQVLFLRDDYSLSIGDTLRVDLDWGTAGRADIGIAVAASATPTPLVYDAMTGGTQSTREDYVTVYAQSDAGNIKSLGVNSINAPPTVFGAVGVALADRADYTELYIRRDTANLFVAGYRFAGIDQDFANWTIDNATVGAAIGFFGDVRAATTFGDLDNLRIVPEPATLALGILGVALCAFVRRRNS